jgi:hypothetical protein
MHVDIMLNSGWGLMLGLRLIELMEFGSFRRTSIVILSQIEMHYRPTRHPLHKYTYVAVVPSRTIVPGVPNVSFRVKLSIVHLKRLPSYALQNH